MLSHGYALKIDKNMNPHSFSILILKSIFASYEVVDVVMSLREECRRLVQIQYLGKLVLLPKKVISDHFV